MKVLISIRNSDIVLKTSEVSW